MGTSFQVFQAQSLAKREWVDLLKKLQIAKKHQITQEASSGFLMSLAFGGFNCWVASKLLRMNTMAVLFLYTWLTCQVHS